jgi:hypothetical protein
MYVYSFYVLKKFKHIDSYTVDIRYTNGYFENLW